MLFACVRRTKDLKAVRIDISNSEEFANAADSLEKLCAIGSIKCELKCLHCNMYIIV